MRRPADEPRTWSTAWSSGCIVVSVPSTISWRCCSRKPHGRRRDARFAAHLGNQQSQVIDEAPRPLFARLERADERVPAALGGTTGVTIRRVVAAADLAALQTD